MMRQLLCLMLMGINFSTLLAQTTNMSAPGQPGIDAHWPTAAKQGFGAANTTRSKVWFTLADGVLTEVYYPTLDVPNVQTLQLIVATPEGKIETESEDSTHSIKITDQSALSFEQENKASSGAYVIYKRYVTDPERETLIVQVSFRAWEDRSGGYSLYICYDPSLNNSGMHDWAWTQNDAL